MLKRFLYMLVVAVTLQLSWGVATAYCMHETGKASNHFGHHQHKHQAADGADEANKSPAKKASPHPDCATCAHSSLGVLSSSVKFVAPAMAAHASQAPPSVQPAPYLGQPERPQWSVAA
jgi:hypothetical protein